MLANPPSLWSRLTGRLGRSQSPRAAALPPPLSLELFVTLWPSFPHFAQFAKDTRLAGIRLNSAKITPAELATDLSLVEGQLDHPVPLWLDIKGRQLRIEAVHQNPDHLDITINHPISVALPTPVLFKAGMDHALLVGIEEHGRRLIFRGGPMYHVEAGDSFHIRHPSLVVSGAQFTERELAKMEMARAAGFRRYFLSYVQSQRDVDEFRDIVGRDCRVYLKIEDRKGLHYVATEFKKCPELSLVAARGDLYIEVGMPHEILGAMRTIIAHDPEACVGSRILLSLVQTQHTHALNAIRHLTKTRGSEPLSTLRPVLSEAYDFEPSCADFSELAWLYDLGYRRMLLCDELCLSPEALDVALAVIGAFRDSYGNAT